MIALSNPAGNLKTKKTKNRQKCLVVDVDQAESQKLGQCKVNKGAQSTPFNHLRLTSRQVARLILPAKEKLLSTYVSLCPKRDLVAREDKMNSQDRI